MPLQLHVFLGKRYTGKSEMVSLRPKTGSIGINTGVSQLIQAKCGEFTHVQLLLTSEVPNAFWIRPCGPKDGGARKLHGAGNDLTCRVFFKELNLASEESVLVPANWDDENNALRVDLPAQN